MGILTMKRDHEWLLSQGFTQLNRNDGCYTYSKIVYIRGVNNTLYVKMQMIPDENSAWTASLANTVPIVNGTGVFVCDGRTPKDAIENLARQENVQIQTIIDVDKPLEEIPTLSPEEERKASLEYVASLPPDVLLDLLTQKMRSSIHTGNADHETQKNGTPCDFTPCMCKGKQCGLRSLIKFYENSYPGPCNDIFSKKLEAIKHMWWDDNATTPDSREGDRGQSYPVSYLVEKTFKKPTTVMSKEDGDAWLLAHGFRFMSEESYHSCTRSYYKWAWDGYISGEERHIVVFDAVPDDGESWSARLVENGNVTDKRCCGDSPMAALDELLRKYELTSEEGKS